MAKYTVINKGIDDYVVPHIKRDAANKRSFVLSIPLTPILLLAVFLNSTELESILSSGDKAFKGESKVEVT